MNNENNQIDQSGNFNDQVYEEIRVREPTINEYMLSLKSKGNKESFEADAMVQIELLSRVTGLPVNAIESFPSSVMDEATISLHRFRRIMKTLIQTRSLLILPSPLPTVMNMIVSRCLNQQSDNAKGDPYA